MQNGQTMGTKKSFPTKGDQVTKYGRGGKKMHGLPPNSLKRTIKTGASGTKGRERILGVRGKKLWRNSWSDKKVGLLKKRKKSLSKHGGINSAHHGAISLDED